MKERKENIFIAVFGTIGTIILSIIVFSADKVDWAGAYLVGLLFVMLFLHIRYNIRKS